MGIAMIQMGPKLDLKPFTVRDVSRAHRAHGGM
jgi:hypothetical protein